MGHSAADESDSDDDECTVAFRYKGIATSPSSKILNVANGVKYNARSAATSASGSRTKDMFGSAMRAVRVMAGLKAVLPETKCAGVCRGRVQRAKATGGLHHSLQPPAPPFGTGTRRACPSRPASMRGRQRSVFLMGSGQDLVHRMMLIHTRSCLRKRRSRDRHRPN